MPRLFARKPKKSWGISVRDSATPWVKEIRKLNSDAAKEAVSWMKDEFERRMYIATASFSKASAPDFKISTGRSGWRGMFWMKAKTTSLPFLYVDLGTKKDYDIPKSPLTDHFLRYRAFYLPKTRPGWTSTRRFLGGVSWGPWRMARQVTHPGIKPRKMTETILKDVETEFMDDILPAFIIREVQFYNPPPNAQEWVY